MVETYDRDGYGDDDNDDDDDDDKQYKAQARDRLAQWSGTPSKPERRHL